MEKTLLEKIDSCTLLLKSCIMSSYFESTISDCSVASILYTLWFMIYPNGIKFQVEIIGLTPELDSFVSPITSVAVNMVKRDVQTLVTPLLKEMLTDVVRSSAPSDLSVLFG